LKCVFFDVRDGQGRPEEEFFVVSEHYHQWHVEYIL
jgi:hypothetical protein